MILKIEKDHQRFRQIVKGRIREDLRKFLTKGELIGKEGKHLISIPVRGIELPHFRYGDNSQGVGAGDGKEGDVVGKGQPGQGKSQGGNDPGQHIMEVDLTLDELADILAEELKLPRIEPKGKHRITTIREKYSSLRRVGPESLRHFKRSFKEARKLQIMLGDYDPDNPVIIPQKKDIRYRSWNIRQFNVMSITLRLMQNSSFKKTRCRAAVFFRSVFFSAVYRHAEDRFTLSGSIHIPVH